MQTADAVLRADPCAGCITIGERTGASGLFRRKGAWNGDAIMTRCRRSVPPTDVQSLDSTVGIWQCEGGQIRPYTHETERLPDMAVMQMMTCNCLNPRCGIGCRRGNGTAAGSRGATFAIGERTAGKLPGFHAARGKFL